MESKYVLRATIALLCASAAFATNAGEIVYTWSTVANNGDLIPGTDKTFNSYNQPAVNRHGMVVFRARSRGGQGQPEHGIYIRDMDELTPVATVFTRGGTVPQPNNALYNGQLARFNEFPSVPRIDSGSDTIATRAQSQPVWTFTLADGSDTRTGTAGVYANPQGLPTSAASMVGDVPGFEYFQVPIAEVAPGTGFDQFPGSPAVTERNTIVFKGNFAAGGVGKTGVFYRDIFAKGGVSPIDVIASSYTPIPGSPSKTFGSTAPPSAAGKYVVFAGYDNEARPTLGGIYRARLGNKPIKLEKVVYVGDPVPGEAGQKFKTFGEAVSLSSNGRHALFWATWGTDTYDVRVFCPNEGNAAVRAYCLKVTGVGGKVMKVPVHQGFFVKDMQLGTIVPIAKTGSDGIKDFIYWNFSGRAPGMGGGEGEPEDIEEPARWRTATFGAVSAAGVPSMSAFKARTGDGKDGIYVREVLPSKVGNIVTLLKTGMPGSVVDKETPAGANITSVGIERDGFRGQWLAVTLGMAAEGGSEEESGWAGVYTARFAGLE